MFRVTLNFYGKNFSLAAGAKFKYSLENNMSSITGTSSVPSATDGLKSHVNPTKLVLPRLFRNCLISSSVNGRFAPTKFFFWSGMGYSASMVCTSSVERDGPGADQLHSLSVILRLW